MASGMEEQQERRGPACWVRIEVLEHPKALLDAALERVLPWTPGELEAMGALRSPTARTSWCMSRLLLRESLSSLGGIENADRRLRHNEFGKPFILNCGLSFNWSHADGCVALAVAPGFEVGVDIEGVEAQAIDHLDIASALFLPRESDWIAGERGQVSWERFLSIFVQKEAILKARGCGLSRPLSEAGADLLLPPHRCRDLLLVEIGREQRYFLAAKAILPPGTAEADFGIGTASF